MKKEVPDFNERVLKVNFQSTYASVYPFSLALSLFLSLVRSAHDTFIN